jgi:hypothetical protein
MPVHRLDEVTAARRPDLRWVPRPGEAERTDLPQGEKVEHGVG